MFIGKLHLSRKDTIPRCCQIHSHFINGSILPIVIPSARYSKCLDEKPYILRWKSFRLSCRVRHVDSVCIPLRGIPNNCKLACFWLFSLSWDALSHPWISWDLLRYQVLLDWARHHTKREYLRSACGWRNSGRRELN